LDERLGRPLSGGIRNLRRMKMKTQTRAQANPHRVTALLLAAIASLSLALVPGSAAGQDVEKDEARADKTIDRDAPITVKVRNNGWLDMRVYAVAHGNRWRLGTAHTGRPLTVEIPRHLQEGIVSLQLVAYPIGGSGVAATGQLLLSPGDQVDWRLENYLAFSTVFVS
jgi:hypothetical protein